MSSYCIRRINRELWLSRRQQLARQCLTSMYRARTWSSQAVLRHISTSLPMIIKFRVSQWDRVECTTKISTTRIMQTSCNTYRTSNRITVRSTWSIIRPQVGLVAPWFNPLEPPAAVQPLLQSVSFTSLYHHPLVPQPISAKCKRSQTS